MSLPLVLLVGLLLFQGVALPQVREELVALQKGIDLMETRGDCPAAIKVFESLHESTDRNTASRALLHTARCRELTKTGDAIPLYAKVIREFPDQVGASKVATERLRALSPASSRGRQTGQALHLGSTAFSVINRIATGAEPLHALSAFGGRQIVVTNASEPNVVIVDPEQFRVIKAFALNQPPRSAAMSLDGTRILLGFRNGNVQALDLRDGRSMTFPTAGPEVHDLVPTPDDRGAYLALGRGGLHKITWVTGETEVVLETPCPMALFLENDRKRLWVSYQCGGPGGRPQHDAIVAFDAETGQSLLTLNTLPNVGGTLQVSPDGSLLAIYAGDACSDRTDRPQGCPETRALTAYVLSTATQRLLHTITLTRTAGDLSFRFVPGHDLLTARVGGSLWFLETKGFSTVGSLPLDTSGALAFSSDGSLAFAPIPSEDSVAVIWLGMPQQRANRGGAESR